jgi:ceramide glucosyltransferase
MNVHLLHLAQLVSFAACVVSFAYAAAAIRCVSSYRIKAAPRLLHPPVTVLKPVCGLDPGLEENLRSFCEQDYPEFEVIFGVRDEADPAVPVIQKVLAEFPGRGFSLVVDGMSPGANPKMANLITMARSARHDLLVIADSDMRVDRGYLSAVAAPFDDPSVGAATCLYTGSAAGGFPSRLATMFINDWFLPSVLVALAFQKLDYCFGATMAIRRSALDSIGGFQTLAGYLADDYMLGHLVSLQGHRVALIPYTVDNIVAERSLGDLLRHELRWARTVRTVRPVGYAFSFLTDAVPLSLVFLALSGFSRAGFAVAAFAIGLRVLLHLGIRARFGPRVAFSPWLVPLRDMLNFGIRAASFLGRKVEWRDQRFLVLPDGRLVLKGGVPSEHSS